MKTIHFIQIGLALLLVVPSFSFADDNDGNMQVVQCENDIASDRAKIQAAVDNTNNRVVELKGICQFDDTFVSIQRSNLTIKGANNDWTVLRGTECGQNTPGCLPGSPLSDDPFTTEFRNRGLLIGPTPLNGTIENIKIHDLKFELFNRAVSITNYNSPSLNCDENNYIPGSFNNIVIKDNYFDNVTFGVNAGSVNRLQVKNNKMTNITGINSAGVRLLGGGSICFNFNTFSFEVVTENEEEDQVKNTVIKNNLFNGYGNYAVQMLGTEDTKVKGNTMLNGIKEVIPGSLFRNQGCAIATSVAASVFAIGADSAKKNTRARIKDNYIHACFNGLCANNEEVDTVWKNNEVRNCDFGVNVEQSFSGNNRFLKTKLQDNDVDVFFDNTNGPEKNGSNGAPITGPSFNNLVTAVAPGPIEVVNVYPGASCSTPGCLLVVDLGINNEVRLVGNDD